MRRLLLLALLSTLAATATAAQQPVNPRMIYTGTPGTTRQIKAGETVEVEVEGVGVLRNAVVQR